MGIFKDLFDDVVDVGAGIIKIPAKLTDDILDTDIEDYMEFLHRQALLVPDFVPKQKGRSLQRFIKQLLP